MSKLIDIISKINVATKDLNFKLLQDVLLKSKQHNGDASEEIGVWNQVSEILWAHMQTGLKKIDDQLLCATCFYTVITLTDKQEYYLSKVLDIIDKELLLQVKDNKDNSTQFQAISIMYGMFQSAFLTQIKENSTLLAHVLKSTFNLLLLMGYEYTQYTFVVFKTINSFKKLCETELQEIIFNKNNQVKLLNLVNHNWENPISGVRDLNKGIFQTLIITVDASMYKLVVDEINGFYWNKAKYLMLSEVVECYKNIISTLMSENNWIDGLLYSLHKPGLVSAGADMYYAILKKTRSEDEWCKIFLCSVIKILNGLSDKAIENFHNYWCLTTLKKYPSLFNIFIDELEKLNDTEQKLYNMLFIIKQGNKLGIIYKKKSNGNCHETEDVILVGIEHYSAKIRLLAFEIVCKSQSKSMPNQTEYELVLEYLSNNVNSDCTVLRLSLIHSLDIFLTQLHISFLNNIKNNRSIDIKKILNFCRKLQELIISSLNLDGNYQRKITCVRITSTLLECFSVIPKKKRDRTQLTDATLSGLLKDNECWLLNDQDFITKLIALLKDPADDIRDNVIKILLNYYSKELRVPQQINNLINDAMISIKSKYFYIIGCGQSMFKLIVNLLLKEKHDEAIFKSVEDIFDFAINELIAEYKLKTDIMESIENGKQLHSFINILLIVVESCIFNSRKIEPFNNTMLELLDTLQSISKQFSWEQQNATSSDFSKMNDMIENIIANSGHCPYENKDETKISGLHQIVLNCLWLNVKAVCDLASALIQYTEDVDICEKCLTIITHALETSRHKGVIEAAGAALGRGIQHLTRLPEESIISKLPQHLVKSKLSDLISEANKMSSITRRGAGLSILVHRIVSNDMKKGKPLFHYFMRTLLKTCNNTEDVPSVHSDNSNIENENDLPKAILIHFLTKIVTDSNLATDVMYYSAELAELAFNHLTSSHWQIRNAALQLYGALIPRQIGQKKDSGTEEETIATVGCDELRTHSERLWKYVINELKNENKAEVVQCHSNLVPILNMLANMAKRYNLSYDTQELKNLDEELLNSLISLLDSPIYTVRRLTAKSIFNIFPFETIYNVLSNLECISENLLNGSLMLLKCCYNYYSSVPIYEDEFVNLREKFKDILNTTEHSYVCKEIFADMFHTYSLDENYLANMFSKVDSNVHAPGIFLWAETNLKKYIHNIPWIEIPRVLTLLLDRNNYEYYCTILFLKIKADPCISGTVIVQIVDILLSFKKKYFSGAIWKILYEISIQFDLKDHVDVAIIIKDLEVGEISYKLRYIIPFAASLLAYADEKSQFALSNIIFKLCDFENVDVDIRYVAALANNELGKVFDKLPDTVKIYSIKSAVMLLQDEDDDVRNLSVNFVKYVTKLKVATHPYICLQKLFDYNFYHVVFNEPKTVIEILHKDLSDILLHNSHAHIDDYNPFANDSKNIYLEVKVLRHLIDNLKNV